MITNETEYDNKQLTLLQNELRDDSIYSGIGIIPGTDQGGSSEGGETGSGSTGGGSGNTGSGNTNTGTGGTGGGTTGGGSVSGGNAEKPTITVLEGEEIAASFYRSDVTIQISTQDKTQNIKYILTTTVDEINNELYPSGLIKEIDIANGGTLTFTKDGEYTITAYAYDVYGQKSEATIMWLKRETGTTPGNGVTVSVASGNEGLNDWYTSNVTIRVLGTDTGSSKVTYRVKGTAHSNGLIGNQEYYIGDVDTEEVEIANGTTFQIALDGEFAIVAYTYDSGGMRLSTATTLNVRRDASRPVVTLYKGTQAIGEGFKIEMDAEDAASGLDETTPFTYRHKLAPSLTYTDDTSKEKTYLYKGLEQNKTYDMYVIATDKAGNRTASDVISRPALWVSNNPTAGDKGTEGAREYYQADVDVSITGQDENNVDISKVTYEIIGTTTGAGVMQENAVEKGTSCDTGEIEMGNEHTIEIRADGNWTINVRTYNKEEEIVTTNILEVTRDTVTPEPPVIAVAEGTMGDDTYYRSDIKVRLTSQDDTCYKKTTYTVTGTATGAGTIGGVSISSGQTVNITETEIANGTTFDIKADGRWTVKGYTYDKSGRKSVIATGIVVTRDTVNPVANTPTITGTVGEATYYRGTPTVKLNGGSDVTSPIKKYTYSITGTTKTAGAIDGVSYAANATVNTGEIDIANNGTFTVGADGTYTVTSYTYDVSGRKSAGSTLTFTRDATAPVISSFTRTAAAQTTINVSVSASDNIALATSGTYQYLLGSTSKSTGTSTTYQYTGLTGPFTAYTLQVTVKDKAGNTASKTLASGTGGSKNFAYTGGQQSITLPAGTYKLEVWGAQGGSSNGGKGAYVCGVKSFDVGTSLFIYVGGQGGVNGENVVGTGGFNGGGQAPGNVNNTTTTYGRSAGGGGATDFRVGSTALSSRIIVAGGGGGGTTGNDSWSHWQYSGGYGGGSGGAGSGSGTCNGKPGSGASLSAGGAGGTVTTPSSARNPGSAGALGVGGAGGSSDYNGGCGGGGGYYGGGGGAGCCLPIAGGGGSSYSGGVTQATMIAGNSSMPSISGGTETGHSGNGYARLTFIE